MPTTEGISRHMPEVFSLETVVALSPAQVSAELGGEKVIVQLDSGIYYGLEEVGAFVWSLLVEKPRSVAELQAAILEEFDVEPEQCLADLRALLAELAEEKLIHTY